MSSVRLPFAKMHGLRNDYVVLDAMAAAPADPAALARTLGDRRSGVGSDGLLLALPSARADLAMRMFNPDGSEAEMCGNGLRCLVFFAIARGLVPAEALLRVETGAGILSARIESIEGGTARVAIDMGSPHVADPLALVVDGAALELQRVSMGNPHAVLFVDDVARAPVERLGPRIECDPAFPARTNVEFVEVVDRGHVRQRTWERGAGETLACGTGACAVVVAAATTGRIERSARVSLAGGDLDIVWADDGHVHMTGPAVHVFDGVWPVS
ncbi:MAG: diaminopimelate epimerase [Planctomycetota bacterium]|nr:diaminopimelate epimerase [Planctomycetota bacterium]